MNTSSNNEWRVEPMVVAFVGRVVAGIHETLFGLKKTGVMSGCIASVGGHVDGEETLPVACAREIKEESGYLIEPSFLEAHCPIVAELTVMIRDKHLRLIVPAYQIDSTDLGGTFNPDLDEFEWLRFIPVDEMPWELLAPGDDEWIKRVIVGGERLRIAIECGTNRRDVLKVTVGKM